MARFRLDPRIEGDSVPIGRLALCDVRLMDRRAWPWLVLVPRRAGAAELHDLGPGDRARLVEEVALAGRVLKRLERAAKINIGALGNVVPQLHVHVVARRKGDAVWPGPVWGLPVPVPYSPEDLAARVMALAKALRRLA